MAGSTKQAMATNLVSTPRHWRSAAVDVIENEWQSKPAVECLVQICATSINSPSMDKYSAPVVLLITFRLVTQVSQIY
uniref:Uncharacterized protein n=1 Tax=Romanomermis culicivorax TaxID=13658 RepID=A0A915IYL7_ROMCU